MSYTIEDSREAEAVKSDEGWVHRVHCVHCVHWVRRVCRVTAGLSILVREQEVTREYGPLIQGCI